MAITGRYSTIDKATIISAGNSLVICGDITEPTINTSNMITPTNELTRDYLLSGSSANINIQNDSKILYAELVWLSTVYSKAPNALDVRSIQDNEITFITPKETLTIAPEFTSSYTSPTGTIDRLRAANITEVIKNTMSGTYTVSKVPTSIPPTGLSEVRAGWALTIIYRNNAFKPKRIVYALGIEAATYSNPIQSAFTGFQTEGNEDFLKGDFIGIFANGNPLDGTDTLKLGSTFARLVTIGNQVAVPNSNPGTAPNNPWNSFSSGQINIADPLNPNKGLLDISGTNGAKNHNAFVPIQVFGARNKWDISCVDISSTLVANQTELAGQYLVSNSTDSLELVAFSTLIDSLAPDIVAKLIAYNIEGDNEHNIVLGEHIVYVAQIINSGKTTANNIILSTALNKALELVPNSITVNGVSEPGADITKGMNVGSIEPSGVINVSFTVKSISLLEEDQSADTFINYNYSFQSGPGSPTYINYSETNTLKLFIEGGSLIVEKNVSQNTIKLGETLTYNTTVTNTGSQEAYNILFQDIINQYCEFVSGTVLINNLSNNTYNPNDGFPLSNLPPREKVTISFQVKVISLSANTVLDNGALVRFSYNYTQYANPFTKTVFSNTTSIQTLYYDIVAKRTCDNYYPDVSDTVAYHLNLTNIGNIDALDVLVKEPPTLGASFVDGSVYVNAIRKPGLNPFIGFIIDQIKIQATAEITYQVVINEIIPDKQIENIANIPYKYQITSGGAITSSEKSSNKVFTRTNYAMIDLTAKIDKSYATIDDILYYTVLIRNTGNIDVANTIFLSSIPKELTFLPNTVKINGFERPGYNPNFGFTIGNVEPDNTVKVTYQVKVTGIPNPNTTSITSSLIYKYLPDPNGDLVSVTKSSNLVQTTINKAEFHITKTVDKNYASVGEYLIYKCILSNTGTVDLSDIFFHDEISTYTSFIPKSVYVNGVNHFDYHPSKGFQIEKIRPTEEVEILFGVEIATAPPFGYVINEGEMTYVYQLSPNSPVITESKKSNEVETNVIDGNLDVRKYTDLSYATLGSKINYKLDISNTGNVTIDSASFFDIFSPGVDFIKGSVSINGISKPDYNIEDGFPIGSLNMGQVVNISFFASVTSIPSPNTVTNKGFVTYSYFINPDISPISKTSSSNLVSTIINKGAATLTKSVDKNYATIDNTLTYTITAYNTGTVLLKDVKLIDLCDTNISEFIPDSVYINDKNYKLLNPNDGFSLPDISINGTVNISFQVKVTDITVPPKIDNYATLDYGYKLSPSGLDILDSVISNIVTTNVILAKINITKQVSKQYVTVGDILTYNCKINNVGNISITDTNFIDLLEAETTFIAESVKINNNSYEDYNPVKGFPLGDIAPSQSISVTFNVTVNSLSEDGVITNYSTLYYNYRINPTEPNILSNTHSNTVSTYIKSGSLTIVKSTNKKYARLSELIEYSFIIANTGNTPLTNLYFEDILEKESTFHLGSVLINSNKKDSYNPNLGFVLDDLAVGNFTKISFMVTVHSLPTNGLLNNIGTIHYSYYINPNENPIRSEATSNQTQVKVNDAIVTVGKSVDKESAEINGLLQYTVDINNVGNVVANFVIFHDLLDNNLSFQPGSVKINEQSRPDFNPNEGFLVDDISANTTTHLTFLATIISRPVDNVISNFASINYKYKINPEDPFIEVALETNRTNTLVAAAELTLKKTADKTFATVGTIIHYSIQIKNTGSVNAERLTFKDILPPDTSFIPGTLIIDSNPMTNLNPNDGFALSDLTPTQSHYVIFRFVINALPSSGKIENTATANFDYRLNETSPVINIDAHSNKVITHLFLGKLLLTKTVDKAFASIGSQLKYVITIENIGNTACRNIFFQDVIDTSSSYIPNSLKVNEVLKPNANPNDGFIIDDISKNKKTTVSFLIAVNELSTDYLLKNTAVAKYKYSIHPDQELIETSSSSNTTSNSIRVGKLRVIKETSKAYATIGDIVSYTVTIVNIGNVDVQYVNFRDIIPSGLVFVNHSVMINDINKSELNPYNSFTLGTITPGNSVVVRFEAKVTEVPVPSLISNISTLVFSYKINPNEDFIVAETNSNAVTTQINSPNLAITKKVDKIYATIGDELTYQVDINNTGNIDAFDILFTDEIVKSAAFVPDSVTINNINKPGLNPQSGFAIDTISTLNKTTITFKVKVISLPEEYSIVNLSAIAFSYKINPNGETYIKTIQSNSVYTLILIGSLTATKNVNLAYATLESILEYEILVKNTGNTTIKSLFFNDMLSDGLQYEPGTVQIDNIGSPLVNPLNGFQLPDLLSGNTTKVTFHAKVLSLPALEAVTNLAKVRGVYKIDPQASDYSLSIASNTVSTNINIGNISVLKEVSKTHAKVGDVISYSNTIKNIGNITAEDTWFYDTLPSNVKYITGTVSKNNVIYPSYDPTKGIPLGALNKNDIVSISFDVRIEALPVPPQILNKSYVQFNYRIDPNANMIEKTIYSNNVITNVVNGELTSFKSVDKSIATVGDILLYNITITNTGNALVSNVFFQDIIGAETNFKEGSVTVNNTPKPNFDPTKGFAIDNIAIGTITNIQFSVIVDKIPESNKVTNQAVTNYEFLIHPNEQPYKTTSYSNTTTTNIALGNLSVTKEVDKHFATIGDILTYTIVIINTGNIDTNHVVFLDPTPKNSVFVINSVRINEESKPLLNPAIGFDLGTLKPGERKTVRYQVEVIN